MERKVLQEIGVSNISDTSPVCRNVLYLGVPT